MTGDVTLQTAPAAHADLLAAIGSHSAITLDLSGSAESDLTLIQLVESARKSATRDGQALRLAEPARGDLLAMLERGGFVAADRPADRAFWLQEAGQ